MLKFQSDHFVKSASFAINGLRLAYKSQRNFKKHLLLSLLYLVISILCKLDVLSLCLIIFACSMTLCLELVNSCVEFIMDAYYKNKWAKLAKLAKDMCAGAVLISSCGCFLIVFILCLEKILRLYF